MTWKHATFELPKEIKELPNGKLKRYMKTEALHTWQRTVFAPWRDTIFALMVKIERQKELKQWMPTNNSFM